MAMQAIWPLDPFARGLHVCPLQPESPVVFCRAVAAIHRSALNRDAKSAADFQPDRADCQRHVSWRMRWPVSPSGKSSANQGMAARYWVCPSPWPVWSCCRVAPFCVASPPQRSAGGKDGNEARNVRPTARKIPCRCPMSCTPIAPTAASGAAQGDRRPLPLDGLGVGEFTHMVMGATGGMVLADLGAEVIKVEPVDGDRTRHLLGSGAGFFSMFNRNKKSIALDLRSPEGLEVAHKLAASADVVVQNFKPGVMAKYGLDYAALSPRNPRLILVNHSGFLPGPYEL